MTQTLSVIQADTWFAIAGGFGVFGLATGLAALRTRALPRWLGWVAIVSGVLWLTPLSFIGIAASIVFVAGTSVCLLWGPAGKALRTAEPVAATH